MDMDAADRPSSAELAALPENALVQLPLSRRGRGPGLLIFLPGDYTPKKKNANETTTLDPEPLQKWAEEGFAVVQLTIGADDDPQETYLNTMDAVRFLLRLPECAEFDKVGVVGILSSHIYTTALPMSILMLLSIWLDTGL